MPNPPPLASTTSFHHRAAQYGVITLLSSIMFGMILSALKLPPLPFLPYLVSLVYLSILIAGIIALCGIPKFGCRKLLWKGLVATFIPISLIVMTLFSYTAVTTISSMDSIRLGIAENISKDPAKHKLAFENIKLFEEAKTIIITFYIPDKTVSELDKDTYTSTYDPILSRYVNLSHLSVKLPSDYNIDGIVLDKNGSYVSSFKLQTTNR